jgi:hypothetical protein
VSLAALLASKRVERHLTSSNELVGLRKLIARDLSDAAVSGLSPDRTFATAYNGPGILAGWYPDNCRGGKASLIRLPGPARHCDVLRP